MGRKKLVKNEEKEEETSSNNKKMTQDDPRLPDKSLFRIDEAADYFGVTPSAVRLWIEHGHLISEKIVGTIRISRESILHCRFGPKILKSEPKI